MAADMTRKQFLQTVAGAAAASVVSVSVAPSVTKHKVKRGINLISYGGDYEVSMTLEDCIADAADMGAEGIEILSETNIDDYPNPSNAWIKQWFKLMEKYHTKPICYDNWIDSRLRKGQELSAKESLDFMLLDLKLAHKLGFKILRPKLGVVTPDQMPTPVWRECMERALPYAEKYDIRIVPEIQPPTPMKSKLVDDFIDLAIKTKTKHFGIMIDLGVFQNRPRRDPGAPKTQVIPSIDPRDMLR